MKFDEAKAACSKLDSRAGLVFIDDLDENAFLVQMALDKVDFAGAKYWGSYYIGLDSTDNPKEYKWPNGNLVSFKMPWCNNEPADTKREVILASQVGFCWMVQGEWWRVENTYYLCEINL